MKKILILEDNMWGHHLEYMSHLYHNLPDDSNCELIYVVPHFFDQIRDMMIDDKENVHVKIDYMSDEEYLSYQTGNYLKGAWNKCRVLKKYAKKHQVDECFLIMLVYYLPLLPFFLPKGCKASGILYRIYYYVWKDLDWMHRLKDILETWILAHFKNIKTVYMLNAPAAADYSNKLYHSTKFTYLPDPLHQKEGTFTDMRKKLGIPTEQCVFLHFGTMTERKGTLTILKALELMTDRELAQHVYIFAGQIYNDIKTEFYQRKEALVQRGAHILVFEEFCSFELLDNLVACSNVILIPYTNVAFSSGILGYAAQFNVPVIGPQQGLLGKLIRNYHLGKTMKKITPESLCQEILRGDFPNCCTPSYAQKNTVRNFTEVIYKHLAIN